MLKEAHICCPFLYGMACTWLLFPRCRGFSSDGCAGWSGQPKGGKDVFGGGKRTMSSDIGRANYLRMLLLMEEILLTS